MLYDPKKFLLIAGPCMLENEAICCEVADELQKSRSRLVNGGATRRAGQADDPVGRFPGTHVLQG